MKLIKERELEQWDIFIPKDGSSYIGYSANHLVEMMERAWFAVNVWIDEETEKVYEANDGTLSFDEAEDKAYDTIKDKFEDMGLLEFFERIME